MQKPHLKVSADEELLVARSIKRDPEALQTLSSDYGRPVYGFLRSVLGRRSELAHPILIDAFVSILRSTSAFNLTEPILVTVMRYLIKGIQKQLKRKDAKGPLNGLNPQLNVMFDGLSRLSWEERVLILLRDQMGFSYEEMTAITSRSEDQIRSQLTESRLHLRSHVREVLNRKRTPIS